MTYAEFDYVAAGTDFYRELDADHSDVFTRRFTPDAVLAFNGWEPVVGRDAIAQYIFDFKANFASLTHTITETTVDRDKRIIGIELDVAYTLEDGTVIPLKGCSFLAFDDDRISGYRIYVDTTALP